MLERVNAVQNTCERTSRGGESDDDRLARPMVETLEEGLSRLRGRPVRIPEMLREPLPSISSFHRERLRVTLDGGKTLRVFFKDLNPEHQTEKARTVRARDLAPSLRELRMYQSVLGPRPLAGPLGFTRRPAHCRMPRRSFSLDTTKRTTAAALTASRRFCPISELRSGSLSGVGSTATRDVSSG